MEAGPSHPGPKTSIEKLTKWDYVKIFSKRTFRSDFYLEAATDEEREVLEASNPPIRSGYIQNFASWRRALLWISVIASAYLCLEQFFEFASNTSDFDFFENGFLIALLGVQIGAAGSIFLSVKRWNIMAESRKWARRAYILLVFGPFIIYLIPWRLLTHISTEFFVASAITTLLPKVFGLFPGIIRSCLTMKSFIPESMLPGWLALVIAPIYSLFFAILVLAAAQGGTILWFVAFASFMAAPLALMFSPKNLVAPLSLDAARVLISGVRKIMFVFYTIGGVCLMLATVSWFEDMELTVWKVFSLICSIGSSVFLSTVVFSDLTLGFIKVAHEQELLLRGRDAEVRLRERLDDLTVAGMTEMLAGEDEVARQLGDRIRDLSGKVRGGLNK